MLDLLNKKPSSVEMPVDGLELVKKSESLLKNYLESQVCDPGMHFYSMWIMDVFVQGMVVDTNRLSTFGEQDVTHFWTLYDNNNHDNIIKT